MLKRWSALFLSLLFLFIVSMPSAQAKYESENKGQLPSGYWLPISTLTVGQAVVLWENSASVAAWERPDWKWGVGGVVLGLGSLAYVGLVGEDAEIWETSPTFNGLLTANLIMAFSNITVGVWPSFLPEAEVEVAFVPTFLVDARGIASPGFGLRLPRF